MRRTCDDDDDGGRDGSLSSDDDAEEDGSDVEEFIPRHRGASGSRAMRRRERLAATLAFVASAPSLIGA